MTTLLITGANGLVGSNVALMAAERGYHVRGLVRSSDGCEALQRQGVELVIGDVEIPQSLDRALAGVDLVLHTAARLGGSWSTSTHEEFVATNYGGSANVLRAAEKAGVERVVCLATIAVFEREPVLTEESAILPIADSDRPYTLSKRAALFDALARASLGQHISFVIPGCIYGPGPLLKRALDPTSFTGAIASAIDGGLDRYADTPLMWSYSLDVAAAALGALERGRRGRCYLAVGTGHDVISLPELCNRALAAAGQRHRVIADAPTTSGRDGWLGERRSGRPVADPSRTLAELGLTPTPLETGIATTVSWLRDHGRVPQSIV